jgi:hypothetical protein
MAFDSFVCAELLVLVFRAPEAKTREVPKKLGLFPCA